MPLKSKMKSGPDPLVKAPLSTIRSELVRFPLSPSLMEMVPPFHAREAALRVVRAPAAAPAEGAIVPFAKVRILNRPAPPRMAAEPSTVIEELVRFAPLETTIVPAAIVAVPL